MKFNSTFNCGGGHRGRGRKTKNYFLCFKTFLIVQKQTSTPPDGVPLKVQMC